jgi:hypothetical protein
MTVPKALPPGSNHHTEVHKVADRMLGISDVAAKRSSAPRPAGPKRILSAELQAKIIRHVTATKTTHGS